MSKGLGKKILAGALVIALLGVSGAGALKYIRKSREVEVLVVPVESLANDYYTQDTVLEGYITTNVTQNIRVDRDMIVDQLHVEDGQNVKKGDLLVSFDMTLVEMELNIARLKKQLVEQNLNKAVNRLNSLKNGGPIQETTEGSESMSGSDGMMPSSMLDNLGAAGILRDGTLLASRLNLGLYAAALQGIEGLEADPDEAWEDIPAEYSLEEPDDFYSDDTPGEPDDDPLIPSDPSQPDPSQPDPSQPDPIPADPDGSDDFLGDFTEVFQFYKVLDDQSKPILGTGTEEDPYIFLCSSAEAEIVAKGSFLNKMAGYDAKGSNLEHVGGYWYQLEFYPEDSFESFIDRQKSAIGFILVNGGELPAAVPEDSELPYLVEESLPFEFPIFDPGFSMGGGAGSGSAISREEAIKSQEMQIRNLKLNLRESDLEISKLEKKVKNKEIYSKIDGIVSTTGNGAASYDAGHFLSVKSKDGYYVKGNINELQLDAIREGTKLNCSSYRSGMFSATILNVADYPNPSNNYGYYGGDTNPNVSTYEFSARIDDPSFKAYDGDWLQVTVQEKQEDQTDKIILTKAFVRSENGSNYVMKEENGVLKKQYVQVGETVDFGYSVVITGGISRSDYLAFPYGKTTVEGARTRVGTMEELYGY